jgi:hypothetical protein
VPLLRIRLFSLLVLPPTTAMHPSARIATRQAGPSAAWKATFHHDLRSLALENWPEDGLHGFNTAESAWLAGTLRFLKHGPGRPTSTRRRVVPAAAAAAAAVPPPPAEPPRRDSSKAHRRQGASPKIRDTDPVRSASRFLNYILIIYTFYAIHTFYKTHYDNSLSFIRKDGFSFIPGIRDADILLDETPLNVEAVAHAENRLRYTV